MKHLLTTTLAALLGSTLIAQAASADDEDTDAVNPQITDAVTQTDEEASERIGMSGKGTFMDVPDFKDEDFFTDAGAEVGEEDNLDIGLASPNFDEVEGSDSIENAQKSDLEKELSGTTDDMDINLTFKNESNDEDNSQIIIFPDNPDDDDGSDDSGGGF